MESETLQNKKPPELASLVVDKFTGDLARLCELEKLPRKGWVHRENVELKDILAAGKKIIQICLVTNYFGNNKIVGKLNTIFSALLATSKKQFIEPNCSLVIWGPREIGANCFVDVSLLVRLGNFRLIEAITEVGPEIPQLPNQSDFDSKFEFLIGKMPEKRTQIEGVRDEQRELWRRSLHMMQRLEKEFPDIHQGLEKIVSSCASRARAEFAMVSGPVKAFDLMTKYYEILNGTIEKEFGSRLTPEAIRPIAEFQTAQLIGDCPLDWRTND